MSIEYILVKIALRGDKIEGVRHKEKAKQRKTGSKKDRIKEGDDGGSTAAVSASRLALFKSRFMVVLVLPSFSQPCEIKAQAVQKNLTSSTVFFFFFLLKQRRDGVRGCKTKRMGELKNKQKENRVTYFSCTASLGAYVEA